MAATEITVAAPRKVLPLYSYASCGKDSEHHCDGMGRHWERQENGSWQCDDGEQRTAEEVRVMR